MNREIHEKLITTLNDALTPISDASDLGSLIENIGDARFVLIGEATHGTEEFYQTRMAISKQLIEKKGFKAIAIEGDWPDAYRIHRYILGLNGDEHAIDALNDFTRFPTWMWRNTTMPPFLTWLKELNDQCDDSRNKVGFYGLDLYSLNTSMEAVVQYLKTLDPNAASRAQERYACFNHMSIDPQEYGYLITSGIKKSCANEALEQFLEMQHHAYEYLKNDGLAGEEAYFVATQNARLVKDAERYYRTMFEGRISSWNVRDQHMADTVDVLSDHLAKRLDRPAKIIIWAHNSHVGDARATEMGDQGEWNIGQLIRERHDANAYAIGFSTYEGKVAAASNWDSPMERKNIVPGILGSYEALFHELKFRDFILTLGEHKNLEHYLKIPRLQRAIGVIYRPQTERASHYFFTRLPYQFDAIIHFDKTTALTPLD